MAEPGRAELLRLYADLRVADVRDAMDALMLHPWGSVDPAIRPLERRRACGIARTVRYLPYRGPIPRMGTEEYLGWSDRYYAEICPYPWVDDIVEGDFIVIDQSGVDAGLMGSDNSLGCLRKGARGFLSSGGVRDTDEIIREGIPFWSRLASKSMVQGRLQFDAKDVAVAVGGVTVMPGDVVVGDGDGVIVVGREHALEVARLAAEEHERDKKRRRSHYQALGWKPDETV